MRNIATQDNSEIEALEQREWRESLDYVIQQGDRDRVHRLLSSLRNHARAAGVSLPFSAVTPYINSIRAEDQTPLPGSQEIERRIKSLVRWNAMAMVVRGNRASDGIGGHISTYASAATLYEVGFNHFFKGKNTDGGGDVIYFQGHAGGRLHDHEPRRHRRYFVHANRQLAGGCDTRHLPRQQRARLRRPRVSTATDASAVTVV